MRDTHRTRRRHSAAALVIIAVLVTIFLPGAQAQTPTEQVASVTAETVPEAPTGWLPVDYVPHALNPVAELPGPRSDWQFPTVLRVDDKLAAPLDGHRFYMWTWLHGIAGPPAETGGRMRLQTADSLEGPWTDRGFVTPLESLSPPGWSEYGWTAGDVVWSPKHRKFFSTPKSGRTAAKQRELGRCDDDSFLMESVDGVHWELSPVSQPVLMCGSGYDDMDHGYGRLLRVAGPAGAERWIWMFRGNEAFTPEKYNVYAIATADDIYGPWTKAAFNPVFDPKAGGVLENGGIVDQASAAAGQPLNYSVLNLRSLVCYDGWFQVLWQDVAGTGRLARSKDLQHWESFGQPGAGEVNPLGEQAGAPVSPSGTGGYLVFDDTVGSWTVLYLGNGDVTAKAGGAGTLVNIARSASGGTPPSAEPSDACPEIVAPTELELSAPLEVESTDPFELSATLTSAGEPVSGAPVDFEVGDLAASALTDADGVATVSLNGDIDPGEHQVRASFGGDDARWPSSKTSVLRVVKDPTVLRYTGATSARGEYVDVAAALADDDANPLSGEPVGFTVAGETVWATTDTSGRAAATVWVPDHGRSKRVDVHYPGATRYRPAATSATITWGAQ